MSDLNRLHNVLIYISDDGSMMSRLNNILCCTSVDKVLNNVVILNDVIGSDLRLDAGKPKYGYYFDTTKRTRAVFILALR